MKTEKRKKNSLDLWAKTKGSRLQILQKLSLNVVDDTYEYERASC